MFTCFCKTGVQFSIGGEVAHYMKEGKGCVKFFLKAERSNIGLYGIEAGNVFIPGQLNHFCTAVNAGYRITSIAKMFGMFSCSTAQLKKVRPAGYIKVQLFSDILEFSSIIFVLVKEIVILTVEKKIACH